MSLRLSEARKLVVLLFPIATALIFGVVYKAIHENDPSAFEFKDEWDSFYFSFTLASTAGFGDFAPKTPHAKKVVMIHQALIMCESLAVMVCAVNVITGGKVKMS